MWGRRWCSPDASRLFASTFRTRLPALYEPICSIMISRCQRTGRPREREHATESNQAPMRWQGSTRVRPSKPYAPREGQLGLNAPVAGDSLRRTSALGAHNVKSILSTQAIIGQDATGQQSRLEYFRVPCHMGNSRVTIDAGAQRQQHPHGTHRDGGAQGGTHLTGRTFARS